ncbi:hypothetical protein TPA0907_56210 [Micromonospora humidisoli]|nr:hypothetical protein TPA0907_56210 [Micromonospora sp. AKA109]
MLTTSTPLVTPPSSPRAPRWMWLLLMLLFAGIIGGVAGLLSYASDDNIPAAILTGGGAFAGALALLLAIAHYTSGG